MDLNELVNNIVDDVSVDLTQEFDRNFERKAFFDRKWPESFNVRDIGSQMNRTGNLRGSINKRVTGGEISWRSSLPYATIQNEGGDIKVTPQMKSFFWAMYYKADGGISKLKSGKQSKSKRNQRLNSEAVKWKALALQKVGATMTIKQRQFIGWHPQVDRSISDITAHNMEEYNKALYKKLKK